MDSFVFAAVLFAAACHAGWNATIKRTLDPLATTTLIALGAGVVAVAAVPFVGIPAAASWPWLIASVVIHLFYFAGLIESYRAGDMGQVYPIARGSAPLMTAIVDHGIRRRAARRVRLGGDRPARRRRVAAVAARRPRPSETQLARRRLRAVHRYHDLRLLGGRRYRRAVGRPRQCQRLFGLAVHRQCRAGGDLCCGAARPSILPAMVPYWRIGLAGGTLTILSYGIAIWAMTLAPIAIVAALRETSVLFGALLAVIFLKEPLRPIRIVAALMVVVGLISIRLQ